MLGWTGQIYDRGRKMELHAITNGYAIYKSNGKIIAEPITQGARQILEWTARNIPANDN